MTTTTPTHNTYVDAKRQDDGTRRYVARCICDWQSEPTNRVTVAIGFADEHRKAVTS